MAQWYYSNLYAQATREESILTLKQIDSHVKTKKSTEEMDRKMILIVTLLHTL